MAQRTTYVARFEMSFSLLFAVMYVAQFVAQEFSKREKWQKKLYVVSSICAVLIVIGVFARWKGDTRELTSGYSWELIRELSDGTVRQVFEMRKEVLETLEHAEKGTDIYIKMPSLPETRVTYAQGLCADVTIQDNTSAAYLFDLNTVAVEYGAR